jgi:hypothetical protein
LRNLIRAINYARVSNKAIIWGMGGHVIKVGLGPVINDLMQHGFVTAVAMNGSSAIHDFEVAMGGATSEEVGDVLGSGKFGMVRETAEQMNGAINKTRGRGIGLGEALGQAIVDGSEGFPYQNISILAEAWKRKIPVTVHVAVGTDLFEVVVSGLYGTASYTYKGRTELLGAMIMLVGASVGAQIGAVATKYVRGYAIRIFFGVAVIGCAVSVALKLAAASFASLRTVFDAAATVLILSLVTALSLYIVIKFLAGVRDERAMKRAAWATLAGVDD